VINELPDLKRYRLVMIDESHNLRNRDGKRYRAIQDYIQQNESKVILLSATPYNKTYLDLSNQLRLFVDETEDLGIRPEQYIKALGGEIQFRRKHQSGVRTLPAFEQSEYIDDWRELMRRYLVRRTRSFIMENYAETDPQTKRKFLFFSDGTRSYFPTRVPKTMQFEIDDQNPDDTYAQLYSDSVVDVISNLKLARYGLANYIVDPPSEPPTEAEQQQLQDLSRGGQRLMGFCRTNLFKRLESSLPWAIIRLVQRAGRVDRIGQMAEDILCYSFLPAEGVERIINLRGRVRARLQQNREVVGTDEAFFEDDGDEGNETIVNLYNEQAGLLDDAQDNDVDLGSHAYQIWKNAITQDPSLEKIVSGLPPVVYSTQPHVPTDNEPEGALVYIRTGQENNALAWIDRDGQSVTESQFAILQAAACEPDTEALPSLEEHHRLVEEAARLIASEERSVGGQLGRPSGARFRTYERLKDYASEVEGTLLETRALRQVIEIIYRYPLRQTATDTLNRQLRSGISNEDLAALVIDLWETERLCIIEEERQTREPQIVCSLGLRASEA